MDGNRYESPSSAAQAAGYGSVNAYGKSGACGPISGVNRRPVELVNQEQGEKVGLKCHAELRGGTVPPMTM